MKFQKKLAVTALFAALAAASVVAQAQTVRIANQGDALSMDPHSLNESLQLSVTSNVYEPLVGRNFSAEDVGNAPTSTESARLFFTEGRRMVGMRLMRLLQQTNPGHLPSLLQTKENDAHELSTF